MKEKELERLTNLKKVEEELYNEKGLKAIAGIDEAGRARKFDGRKKVFEMV